MADSKLYIIIWLVLIEATLLEVVTRFLPTSTSFFVAGIILIATAKSVIIALYYQNLRYETKVLSILLLLALSVLATLLIASILSVRM